MSSNVGLVQQHVVGQEAFQDQSLAGHRPAAVRVVEEFLLITRRQKRAERSGRKKSHLSDERAGSYADLALADRGTSTVA